MFGCCDRAMMYKYINEDGTIDESRLINAFSVTKIEYKLEKNFFGEEVKVPYTEGVRVCKCKCHQDGFMVMC